MNESNHNSRRKFIKTTFDGVVLASLGVAAIVPAISSCNTSKKTSGFSMKTGFDQQPLTYAYDALENIIDAQTMEIHYSKHAALYAKNAKEAAIAEGFNVQEPTENLLANISKYSTKLRNNAGGHYNHEMFWQCMRPKTANNIPEPDFLKVLEDQFGSFSQFKAQFSEAAKTRFGSGWAWLYKNNEGKLKIVSTANQDNPLMDLKTVEHHGFPLLCIDVWEHAYYLKYQNKRADYIEKWWDLVNWNYVKKRFDAI